MAYQHPGQPEQDIVSGEQYRYALTNFRIAHEKVEQQRVQLEEQEKQIALLRARIALLEGGTLQNEPVARQGRNSVDDFSIRSAASKLEKLTNRWAADIVRDPPTPLVDICQAILSDVANGYDQGSHQATPMQVQNLLRHAMSETIAEGTINCFVVTNSSEANIQLTRIHEHLFARDPTVAGVWRRQTFSAAVETCSPEISYSILADCLPATTRALYPSDEITAAAGTQVLESAYEFSRMVHGSSLTSGGGLDAFYRAFVPELGSTLLPRQMELVKRCLRSERGDVDRVGATIFPGLVKVTQASGIPVSTDGSGGIVQNVVRRAQVICECALGVAVAAPNDTVTLP